MGFENPTALWVLLALPLLFIFALWRFRPLKVVIPSIHLWDKIKDRNPPIKALQKPQFNMLLLFQILAVTSGVIAIAFPFLEVSSSEPKRVIIVFDTSASMKTKIDANKIRFDRAVAEAEKLLKSLRYYDTVEIYTTVADDSYFSGKRDNAITHLRKLTPTDCEDNIADICKNAFISIPQGENVHLFLISDRDTNLADVDKRFEKILVGGKSDNIGIEKMSIDRRVDGLYDLFISVGNFSGSEVKVPIKISSSGVSKSYNAPVGVSSITFEKVNIGSNDYIETVLDREDGLSTDNRAGAFRFDSGQINILLVGVENRFLAKSLRAIPDVNFTISRGFDTTFSYDVYIYNEVLPQEVSANGDIVVVNPPSNFGNFRFGNVLDVATVDVGHSELLESVNIDELKITGVREILTDLSVTNVFTAEGKPIAVLYVDGAKSILITSFGISADSIDGSRWMYYPSFPIFWANYVEFVKGRRLGHISDFTTAKTCAPLNLPYQYKNASAKHLESGEKPKLIESSDGKISFIPHSVGRYQLEVDNVRKDIYVNLFSENETNNNGIERLLPDKVFEGLKIAKVRETLLPHFAVLAVLFMLMCWLLERRMY